MGLSRNTIWTVRAVATLAAALVSFGCQSGSVSTAKLVANQSRVDFNGLESTHLLVDVSAAGACAWTHRPPESSALYSHEQWRSPTGITGVGIVYLHLPLPVGPSAVLWLAEQHFASIPGGKGHVLGEWTDLLGRSWFMAQSTRLHVSGYIMTEGYCAWIVYFAYKSDGQFHPAELSLAARSVESFVPLTEVHEPAGPNVADATRQQHLAATE